MSHLSVLPRPAEPAGPAVRPGSASPAVPPVPPVPRIEPVPRSEPVSPEDVGARLAPTPAPTRAPASVAEALTMIGDVVGSGDHARCADSDGAALAEVTGVLIDVVSSAGLTTNLVAPRSTDPAVVMLRTLGKLAERTVNAHVPLDRAEVPRIVGLIARLDPQA